MNVLIGMGAILAGFVFIIVTHTATDFVLQKLGIFPPLDRRGQINLFSNDV